MSGLRLWIMAARPRTLPAAVSPVIVGTAVAVAAVDSLRVGPFVAALLGSIFIQIGTNLANDYSDAKRGADAVDRLGPVRVTASGLVAPRRVLAATWIAFGVAVAAGIYLTVIAGPIILAVGATSIVAGVLYTGGPRPYGYEGLGEVFVFVFFGLIAVNGSYFVQLERLDILPATLSVLIGLLTSAILIVNNVRDIETDRRAGKRTFAVRAGRARARLAFEVSIAASYVLLPIALLLGDGSAWGLLALVSLPLAFGPIIALRHREDGASLNVALARTGQLLAAYSLLLSAGLLIGT